MYKTLFQLLLLFTTLLQGASMTENPKILAFGDSITFGYGAAASQSYPSYLEKLSNKRVINAGIPGENSTEGLVRLRSLLKEESQIKTLILCHGANDILHNASMTRLRKNIKDMVELAKSKGLNVLLIGVVNFQSNNMQTLPLYQEIAKEEHISYNGTLLKTIESNPSLKSDAVHPNAKGYKIMAEKIYQELQAAKYLK